MSQEAMKLALEAIKELHRTGDTQLFDMYYAQPVIKALEEALAKQEQRNDSEQLGEPVALGSIQHLKTMMEESAFDGRLELSDALLNIDEFYTTPQPKQEQGEPVTQTDGQTRPWFTIDELNEWADKYQNQEWRNAAIRLGEELASVGPDGYYNMEAKDWLDWAMANVKSQIEFAPVKVVAYNCTCGKTMKFESEHGIVAQQRTWVGLTDEEIEDCYKQGGIGRAVQMLKEKNT